MPRIPRVRIEHYDSDHIANPNPNGDLSWDQFDMVGTALLSVCEKYGDVWCGLLGPEDRLNPEHADFHIEDTQWNDELYHYVWLAPEFFTGEWLADMIDVLHRYPGWGVGIQNVDQAYILLFGDKLMVTGECFARCHDVESVIEVARRQLASIDECENST